MSWLLPDEFASELLSSCTSEVLELAKLVSLSPRIEPLLLRNMRVKYLPDSGPELESQLWFSSLVSARSTQNIVLYHDVAKVLAEKLKAEPKFSAVWIYTQQCTAHWSTLDLLEQTIRYESLKENNQTEIDNCLQQVLWQLSNTNADDERLNLARWAKSTLPIINSIQPSEPTELLAQYSATALGAIADWTTLSSSDPMPSWLANLLPAASEGFTPSKIGLHLHYDDGDNHMVLECIAADKTSQVIDLPTPLPARIFIKSDQQPTGSWEIVNIDSRIKISPASNRLELSTIDGKRYQLVASFTPAPVVESATTHDVFLTYVQEDEALALQVSKQLAEQGIRVSLLEESPNAPRTTHEQSSTRKFLRLWTTSSQKQWQGVSDKPLFSNQSLLLQWQDAELPKGMLSAPVIRLTEIQTSIDVIQQWLTNESVQTIESFADDIDTLLKELENPETKPRRRLAIGDRLAELGDPRKGVGVKEYEIIEYAPEVQRLLDELNDINTQPPRRLEIGDQLAEMGDPRFGVGLDENGLPEIDWVEIPAGPFIYGEEETQKTLDLPAFKISRYPVTNSQFQSFIDAGGYENERWWQGLKKPEPTESGFKQVNRPREMVTWFEAMAYSRWLSEQLGVKVNLPTEQQWEKAARGSDGKVYPWGNDYRSGYANHDETINNRGSFNLDETTAVGMYPQGESPYHLVDMAGNVWEWCVNNPDLLVETELLHDSEGSVLIDANGETLRTTEIRYVLRGGSWYTKLDYLRSAYRGGSGPYTREYFIGFRLAQDLPS